MKKVYNKINMDMLKCTTSAILTASDPQLNGHFPTNDGENNENQFARGNGNNKTQDKLDLI